MHVWEVMGRGGALVEMMTFNPSWVRLPLY